MRHRRIYDMLIPEVMNMKRRLCTLLVLVLVFSLFVGCHRTEPVPTVPTDPTVPTGEPTNPPTTEPSAPTEATQPTQVTQPPTEATQPTDGSYLQRVTCADQSVFAGPSYDYSFVATVQQAGTYTIVEETVDEEGNLWGKLKSGLGWIDLTDVRQKEASPPLMTANFADDLLLGSGNYHAYGPTPDEFTIPIAFRVSETVEDVFLYGMLFVETWEQTDELYRLYRLDPDKPFVAHLPFPGDMSMYCISFRDGDGVVHSYTVMISGRNGSLLLTPYTP